MIGFILFISFVILQRLIELVIARKNERWARSQGAMAFGEAHYPYIVALHTLFIAAMIAEYLWKAGQFNLIVLIMFLILIAFKIWALSSLGKYWNTKILRIPGSVLVRKRAIPLVQTSQLFYRGM
jgi:methyltransferase